MSKIRFSCFPRTLPPPQFVDELVNLFRSNERDLCTVSLGKGLKSDEVMAHLREGLEELGFQVEKGKLAIDKVRRPVFFGENGTPDLQYEVDAYHPGWKCGLEIEAGRGWMGNAIYRDLVQALVMVDVDVLVLAVANAYKYKSGGKTIVSGDYDKAVAVADALYGHGRIAMPYRLVVLGY